MKLKGKAAIVTGASNGIGAAIAAALAQEGAQKDIFPCLLNGFGEILLVCLSVFPSYRYIYRRSGEHRIGCFRNFKSNHIPSYLVKILNYNTKEINEASTVFRVRQAVSDFTMLWRI